MNVGMFSEQLDANGGIERVVRELFRIFGEHGCRTWACCASGHERQDFWVMPKGEATRPYFRELIRRERPDCFLIHYVRQSSTALELIEELRDEGVPCVAVVHASFPSPLLLDSDERTGRDFLVWASQCDLIATVSAIDAQWWRALGCRALHTQNPFVRPTVAAVERSSRLPRHALWVGRVAPQKKPERALAVWKKVTQTIPDAKLTMIGGNAKSWSGLQKMARKLGVADSVTFLPAQDDLSALWQAADIHLLTSVTESFCLVLAEAKAWGLPTAMFDIPFLELVGAGQGLITRPQGDVDGLAAGIVELMQHPDQCRRLGAEAKASLAPFNDEAVWQSWWRVFEALRTGQGGTEVSPEVRMIVSQMNLAWDDFCDRNLWAVTFVRDWQLLCRCSWRSMARCVSALVAFIRKIKSILRGA